MKASKISEGSTWTEVAGKPFPRHAAGSAFDVAIIGGGITGVMAAYLLAQAGREVALFEAGTIASGITAYTTAFLTEVIDTDLPDLIKMYGPKKARLVWQSGARAIDAIEEIVEKERISCEFVRCPLYYYANSAEEFERIKKEYKAATNLGLRLALRAKGNLGFPQQGYLEVPHQAKFHPLKFVFGLAAAAEKLGVQVVEHAKVAKLGAQDGAAILQAGRKKFRAGEAVIATYAPFENDLVTFLKKGMYTSYVLEARIPKGILKEGLYQDGANPYHYFRIDPQGKYDRMILGGEDHREELKMDPEKNYGVLEEYLGKILPGGAYAVTRRWSSGVLEPTDGLALIGRLREHQLAATAFSGNGMTYAAISGLVLRDILSGTKNPWIELYDPKRIPNPYQLMKKGRDYVEEFVGGAVKNTFRDR